jgi:hypothetical protein
VFSINTRLEKPLAVKNSTSSLVCRVAAGAPQPPNSVFVGIPHHVEVELLQRTSDLADASSLEMDRWENMLAVMRSDSHSLFSKRSDAKDTVSGLWKRIFDYFASLVKNWTGVDSSSRVFKVSADTRCLTSHSGHPRIEQTIGLSFATA